MQDSTEQFRQEAEREARRAEKEFKTAPTGHNKEKLN
jgi:hypothetical protein